MVGDSAAIRVTNLSKCYQVYDRPQDRLKQSILPRLRGLLGRSAPKYYRDFWALRDVSFDIGRGETVGIVGRNGSGKSTLLQLICGTLAPTDGEVEVSGRVAALLELGAGFNPEFTGRENVYLNASVLGLSRAEIDGRFDIIADFADIGQFIEQPVKTYSSGMIVRLAFAVAINVEPEILIVDEALAVGDERFQRKCYSRIEDIKSSGATVLFVTHSGATVIELCDSAILLDDGEKLAIGRPKHIVGRYQRLLYAGSEQRNAIRAEIIGEALNSAASTVAAAALAASNDDPTVHAPLAASHDETTVDDPLAERFDPSLVPYATISYPVRGADISAAIITTISGQRVNNLRRGREYYFRYHVLFMHPARKVRFGMLIKTVAGVELGGAISAPSDAQGVTVVAAGARYAVDFRFSCQLNPGVYFLNAGILGAHDDGAVTYLCRHLDVAMFRVLPEGNETATGLVDFGCVAYLTPTATPPHV